MTPKPGVEAQYKTLLLIWAALLMSQPIFVVLVWFTRPDLFRLDLSESLLGPSGRPTGSSAAVIIGFAVAAVTAVGFSFAFRRRLKERAVAEQNTAHVQSGLIIALALCEAASLFGLTLALAFDYPYFFIWIGLGILGMILHFPKRDDVLSATYKQSTESSPKG